MEPNVSTAWLNERLVGPGSVWTAACTVATTGSTNADIAAAARDGAESGLVLVSDHQSAGRGRFTRVWEAPPGTSLAISALLRPTPGVPMRRWSWLPLLTGLAVADGLRVATGVRAEVKWPNDVLIEGRKVCGILAESVDGDAGPAAVIGMGVNTTLAEHQLPVPTATSLVLAGVSTEPGEVVVAILDALGQWYLRWLGGADLRADYAARCSSVGRTVRVQQSATESVVGEATGVDADGLLLVVVAGRVLRFAAGDVAHLR